jgi:hypothetical protein
MTAGRRQLLIGHEHCTALLAVLAAAVLAGRICDDDEMTKGRSSDDGCVHDRSFSGSLEVQSCANTNDGVDTESHRSGIDESRPSLYGTPSHSR